METKECIEDSVEEQRNLLELAENAVETKQQEDENGGSSSELEATISSASGTVSLAGSGAVTEKEGCHSEHKHEQSERDEKAHEFNNLLNRLVGDSVRLHLNALEADISEFKKLINQFRTMEAVIENCDLPNFSSLSRQQRRGAADELSKVLVNYLAERGKLANT